jgi:hypothetical protein
MRHLLLIAAVLASQGCVVNVNRDRSIGRELIELQQARAAGTLSEADYRSRRADVLAEAETVAQIPSMPAN